MRLRPLLARGSEFHPGLTLLIAPMLLPRSALFWHLDEILVGEWRPARDGRHVQSHGSGRLRPIEG